MTKNSTTKTSKKPIKKLNIEPHPDWIEVEGFTQEQWDALDPADQQKLVTDWDGGRAIEIRKELRAADSAADDQAVQSYQATTTAELMAPGDHQGGGQVVTPPEDDSGREAALSIVGGVTTEQLKTALTVQTEQRALIQQFIKDNLVVDIDYGKIHVIKNCQQEERARGSCDKDYHYSKSILFKPGQEKIFSLFGITDELEKDTEVYEMFQNVPGLVAYKCVMYRGKNKIGEGRGAATLSANQNDPNSTIKKAEKRARMDACLSLGFSAYFTQDLDDPEYKSQREMMIEKAKHEAERRDKDDLGLWKRDADEPIDNDERAMLYALCKQLGYEHPDSMLELLRANGIKEPKELKSGQARDLIRKLKTGDYTPVAVRAAQADTVINDIDDNDIAGNLDAAVDSMSSNTPPAEPVVVPEPEELVVDDELKSELHIQITGLGLNERGMMWLKKFVTGKPWSDFDTWSDVAWRKAYDMLEAITDHRMDVPEDYIAGLVQEEVPTRDPSEPTRNQTEVAQ